MKQSGCTRMLNSSSHLNEFELSREDTHDMQTIETKTDETFELDSKSMGAYNNNKCRLFCFGGEIGDIGGSIFVKTRALKQKSKGLIRAQCLVGKRASFSRFASPSSFATIFCLPQRAGPKLLMLLSLLLLIEWAACITAHEPSNEAREPPMMVGHTSGWSWQKDSSSSSSEPLNQTKTNNHKQDRYYDNKNNNNNNAIHKAFIGRHKYNEQKDKLVHLNEPTRLINSKWRARRSSPTSQPGEATQASPVAKAVNCDRSMAFWLHLRAAYPLLAWHLLSLSLVSEGEQQASLVGSRYRQVSRLLEEAERLLREQQQRPADSDAASSNHMHKPATVNRPIWLNKLMNNPVYARLLQRFQEQQQRQSKTNKAPANLQAQQASGEQQPTDSHVYGRVLHYPHEASSELGETNEAGTGNVLDKLHQLSQQQRASQQLGQDSNNEISRSASNNFEDSAAEPEVSNKIAAEWTPRSSVSENEAARNRFVYGSVVLKPSQQNSEASQRLRTLGALKQLSSQLDASINRAQIGDTSREQSEQSFGHIAANPPSQIDAHVLNRNQQQQPPDDRYLDPVNKQQDEPSAGRWLQVLHTDKLRDQMSAAGRASVEAEQASSMGGQDEEVSVQQNGQKVQTNMAEEFEGLFHDRPLDKVEVRQFIQKTTASPGGLLIVE